MGAPIPRVFRKTQQIRCVANLSVIDDTGRMAQTSDMAITTGIGGRILTIGGHRVLLDSDLAALYGVPTHRLNEAVKRNVRRFPPDFSFVLTKQDLADLISQIAISKVGRGGRRKVPRVYSEHGALMAATVLNSPEAVEMSVYVVRAFIELRATLTTNARLARKLDALEKSVVILDADSRRQFKELRALVFSLAVPPASEQ